jgi:hypothetical protein
MRNRGGWRDRLDGSGANAHSGGLRKCAVS